jgi:hypothetical protein
MFTYNISKTANSKDFKRACSAIESKLKGIEKDDLITDVDGTQIQIYNTKDGKIKVFNDYEVDAVYADSEVDLTEIL